jgi:hypothetical protein
MDSFDSTTMSMRIPFPGARLGICLRHALLKLPKKLMAVVSPVREVLRSQFHTLRKLRLICVQSSPHAFLLWLSVSRCVTGED